MASVFLTYAGIMAGCTVAGWGLARLLDARRRRYDPDRKHPRGKEEEDPYRLAGPALTEPEQSLHRALMVCAPRGFVVLAKVRLADFLLVNYGAKDRSEAHGRIGGKSVDFLVCDAAYVPRLAVCLSAAADDRDRARTRDFIARVCAKAGLPLELLPVRATYTAEEIAPLVTRHVAQ